MGVDIYSSGDSTTTLIAQNVSVLDTSIESGGSLVSSDNGWITLAVEPDSVQDLIAASNKTMLYFTLPGERPLSDDDARSAESAGRDVDEGDLGEGITGEADSGRADGVGESRRQATSPQSASSQTAGFSGPSESAGSAGAAGSSGSSGSVESAEPPGASTPAGSARPSGASGPAGSAGAARSAGSASSSVSVGQETGGER